MNERFQIKAECGTWVVVDGQGRVRGIGFSRDDARALLEQLTAAEWDRETLEGRATPAGREAMVGV